MTQLREVGKLNTSKLKNNPSQKVFRSSMFYKHKFCLGASGKRKKCGSNFPISTLFRGEAKTPALPFFYQITVGGQQKMTTLMVCKLNLVYQQKSEAKKGEIFWRNPILAP